MNNYKGIELDIDIGNSVEEKNIIDVFETKRSDKIEELVLVDINSEIGFALGKPVRNIFKAKLIDNVEEDNDEGRNNN